jgi:Bax protein
MIRPAPPRRTFEWTVIAFTGLCIALLYGLVVADHLARDAGGQGTGISSKTPSSPGGKARKSSWLLPRPVMVQYVAPSVRLRDVFDGIDYRLDGVRRHGEVPRLFFVSLPADLQRIRQPGERKAMFIKTALPLVLHANEIIRHERARITSLRDKAAEGLELDAEERAWLERVAREYGIEKPSFARLLRRVDVIPPSLALAQAAEESGWGTSRFAHEGNAIFGQRTWRRHDGIVPEQRSEGETFKVRTFGQLIDGVRSYTRNLNSHFAYDEFRRAREAQRIRGERPDGYALAEALSRYSERGEDYVETIRTIIRVNGLRAFDRSRLRDRLAAEDGRTPDA